MYLKDDCTYFRSLRLRLPNKREEYNAEYVSANDSTLLFNLQNQRGDKLVLTIAGVENQRFRVIVEEPDRHRYSLEHSLEKEPNPKS